jgi:hypothetical protein
MKHSTIDAPEQSSVQLLKVALVSLLLMTTAGCSILSATPGKATVDNKLTPTSFSCTNDIEVQCDTDGCSVEDKDAFTPMSVTFDNSGTLSVCAYTGCYEGTAEVWQKASFLSLHAGGLAFSSVASTPDDAEDIAITIDLRDSIAVLKVGAFAQPLLCKSSST